VEQKVAGKQITTLAPAAERAQVIDLMDALKQSLDARGSGAKGARKPAAKVVRKAEAAPKKKVASRR
jgi:non-homologous end joining protein Ku